MIKALEELRSERQSRHGRPIHGMYPIQLRLTRFQ